MLKETLLSIATHYANLIYEHRIAVLSNAKLGSAEQSVAWWTELSLQNIAAHVRTKRRKTPLIIAGQ